MISPFRTVAGNAQETFFYEVVKSSVIEIGFGEFG
jgi:hypothetical protein